MKDISKRLDRPVLLIHWLRWTDVVLCGNLIDSDRLGVGACPGPWEVHSVIKFILWNWSNSWGLRTAGACIAGPDQWPVSRPSSWWHVTMSAAPGSSSANDGSDPGLVIVLQTPGSLWTMIFSVKLTVHSSLGRSQGWPQNPISYLQLCSDWLWLVAPQ